MGNPLRKSYLPTKNEVNLTLSDPNPLIAINKNNQEILFNTDN